ncbi:TPA: hypothetical protein EYO12_01810 [Candidatus Saccharibacteria bacterium]|nr:hypothetical protein [Candidatus Saccharibacteria bacterium]HIO87453.1 hypothetical protein [Candidatus Saccharibacteria bacterium]
MTKNTYQICVSGAAGGKTVETGHTIAFDAGVAIAKAGHQIMTGATVGLPDRAAQGAKSVGGISVGISPAATKLAHTKKYRLPTESYDVILFTGLHYIGRDVLLISSSDAVIFIGGRLGTLHEFTIAMEQHKPCGVLLGAGGTTEEFDDVMRAAGMRDFAAHRVVFDTDPVRLVRSVEEMLRKP